MNDHTAIEKATYEALYSGQAQFSSLDIREGLLQESEDFFCNRLAQLCKGARVLEIGCGMGKHAFLAAQAGATKVVATDVSETAIRAGIEAATAKGVSQTVIFRQLNIEKENELNEQFDVVLNHEVFSSLDLTKALPNIRSLLRPGGVLLSIECLRHNPIFNLNRKIGVLRGRRTAWAAAHVITMQDIEMMRASFPQIDIQFFHLLTIFAAPLWFPAIRKTTLPIVKAIKSADEILLRNRMLQAYAFKAVIEAK